MTLLIIRHGETPLNVSRVLQPADTPLSANGLAQAAALAQRLAGDAALRPTALVSSDLPRALQTAQAIAAACGLPLVTWTIRTQDELQLARDYSAAPIFEGFAASQLAALALSPRTPI